MHQATQAETPPAGLSPDHSDADLTNLVLPENIVERFPHVFGSVESLRWFERNHRAELIECGALLHMNGRKMYNLPRFSAAALSIGQRLAAAAARKG